MNQTSPQASQPSESTHLTAPSPPEYKGCVFFHRNPPLSPCIVCFAHHLEESPIFPPLRDSPWRSQKIVDVLYTFGRFFTTSSPNIIQEVKPFLLSTANFADLLLLSIKISKDLESTENHILFSLSSSHIPREEKKN